MLKSQIIGGVREQWFRFDRYRKQQSYEGGYGANGIDKELVDNG